MESVFQSLHNDGVGAEIKHIPLITKEEEATLWEKGILGDASSQALLRSVFFLNGKNICLRGGSPLSTASCTTCWLEMDAL